MLKFPLFPRLLKKVQVQGGTLKADEAYWRYAAASGKAGQRRRWAFFSSLLIEGAMPCKKRTG